MTCYNGSCLLMLYVQKVYKKVYKEIICGKCKDIIISSRLNLTCLVLNHVMCDV